jgi:hypothetical protein
VAASVEVAELVQRADAFLEASPAIVLRDWDAHRRRLRFQVGLPSGLEAPLRPLFVERGLVDELIAAAAPGLPTPQVAMPMGAGTRGALTLTEPPHGREWLLHAAYVHLMGSPWLRRLEASKRRLTVPDPLSALQSLFAPHREKGAVALLLGDDDVSGVLGSDARVMQLLWFVEAWLTEAGVPARSVSVGELATDGDTLRFDDGAPVSGVAPWSLGRVALEDRPSELPAWSARGPALDRRALASLASATGSRYAPAQLEAPTSAVDDWVFKPFSDAWTERAVADAAGEGVFQRRVELPRARLPVVLDGAIQWRECGVELGALAIEGRCAAAFGRCVFSTPEGPVDVICPAVLVE